MSEMLQDIAQVILVEPVNSLGTGNTRVQQHFYIGLHQAIIQNTTPHPCDAETAGENVCSDKSVRQN